MPASYSTPLRSAPLHSTPLQSNPIQCTPLQSSSFRATSIAIARSSWSSLRVSQPPGRDSTLLYSRRPQVLVRVCRCLEFATAAAALALVCISVRLATSDTHTDVDVDVDMGALAPRRERAQAVSAFTPARRFRLPPYRSRARASLPPRLFRSARLGPLMRTLRDELAV